MEYPVKVKFDPNPYIESITMQWDSLNSEQHRVLGNGCTVSHTYNPNGWETLLENRDTAGVGIAIFTNTYSCTGNRVGVLAIGGIRSTFSYDATSQLVSKASGGTMAYAHSAVVEASSSLIHAHLGMNWDPNGNRIR